MDNNQIELLKKRFSILYPMVDEQRTPLPKSWNVKDKFRFLYLSNHNLRVHYRGLGNWQQHSAASIRTAHHIPHACGVYYFEIKVLGKGQHGFVAVGLASRKSRVNHLPGWDNTSYGYHGDDGYKFHSSDIGKSYGPKFTVGDVIGCGIDFLDRKCFFTKNGHYLGIAFTDVHAPCLYPSVGLQTKGDMIEANFGQEPFLFNMDFIKDELKARVKLTIENFPYNESNKINKIILSYLVHHGYIETARVFAKATGQRINEDFPSIYNRKNIMKLIRLGKIESAINLTNQSYPKLLENKEDLHFRLLCRQFIELFNETPDFINYFDLEEINTNLIENVVIEENRLKTIRMLKLGQQIYRFNKELTNSNSNDISTSRMKEAFSLIAYNDPKNSNMKWLLENVQREPICNELNSTILEYLKKPPMTVLDLAPNIAKDLLYFMAHTSNPSAVFVNLEDYTREQGSAPTALIIDHNSLSSS